jgi:integrase
MPKKAKELSALEVKRIETEGMHAVGGVAGLYLNIKNGGGCSWILRCLIGGKRRDMGLGGYPDVSLAVARDTARQIKEQIRNGIDVVTERQRRRDEIRTALASKLSFREASTRCHLKKASEFKNSKHAAQWINTLETYAFPVIGDLNVDEITTSHVESVLTPVWETKTETATRLRQRIEHVLTWASVSGYRRGENVARWRGHLDALLPAPNKLKKLKGSGHHSAMHYRDVPKFMAHLQHSKGIAASALEFLILTAARSGEVRLATWDEFDIKSGVWTVPGSRMKAGVEHRVPLTAPAINILKAAPRLLNCNIVFPSVAKKVPMTSAGLAKPLKLYDDSVTVHGFRSAFRSWCSDVANIPDAIAEAALSHVAGDKTVQAYQRGDMFDKRRELMTAWSDYCGSWVGGQVVSMTK